MTKAFNARGFSKSLKAIASRFRKKAKTCVDNTASLIEVSADVPSSTRIFNGKLGQDVDLIEVSGEDSLQEKIITQKEINTRYLQMESIHSLAMDHILESGSMHLDIGFWSA